MLSFGSNFSYKNSFLSVGKKPLPSIPSARKVSLALGLVQMSPGIFYENLDQVQRKPVGSAPVLPQILPLSSDLSNVVQSCSDTWSPGERAYKIRKANMVKRKPVGTPESAHESALPTGTVEKLTEEETTKWKYYAMKFAKDIYVTTNPDHKHMSNPVGPSYYVEVDHESHILSTKTSENRNMILTENQVILTGAEDAMFPITKEDNNQPFSSYTIKLSTGSWTISNRGFSHKIYIYNDMEVIGMMNLRHGYRSVLESKISGEHRIESSDEEDDHNKDMIGWIYLYEKLSEPDWSIVLGLLLFFGYSRRWN